MRRDQVLTIYRKELLETLRDRRTLIIMVVVPIILYPLIALVAVQAVSMVRSKVQEKPLSFGLADANSGNGTNGRPL